MVKVRMTKIFLFFAKIQINDKQTWQEEESESENEVDDYDRLNASD